MKVLDLLGLALLVVAGFLVAAAFGVLLGAGVATAIAGVECLLVSRQIVKGGVRR